MRQVAIVLGICVSALCVTGCEKPTIRNGEGQYCSSSRDEDPYFECSRSNEIVCITTSKIAVYDPVTLAMVGTTPKYACRKACTPGEKSACPISGDVCCAGLTFGRNYGKAAGCVPAAQCDSLLNSDAGVKDAATKDSVTGDGGEGDSQSDRDADNDAPADLAVGDAGSDGDAPASDADGLADAGALVDAAADTAMD